MATIYDLRRIAEVEFSDIVKEVLPISYKIRIILIDNSFIDANLSKKLPDRFDYKLNCFRVHYQFVNKIPISFDFSQL